MSAAAIAAIVVVVAIVGLVILAMILHRRRVQQRFGAEYSRLVAEHRSQFKAQAELGRREWRVQRLSIRPLTDTERATFAADWTAAQARFVDQPRQAVTDGGDLVAAIMKERGYLVGDPDRIVGDLSVAHPGTVTDYRVARQISMDAAAGQVSTEDLRQAMIHYRTVFAELLGRPGDGQPGDSQPRDESRMAESKSRMAESNGARATDAGTGYAEPRVVEPSAVDGRVPATEDDPMASGEQDAPLDGHQTGRFRAWVPRARAAADETAGR